MLSALLAGSLKRCSPSSLIAVGLVFRELFKALTCFFTLELFIACRFQRTFLPEGRLVEVAGLRLRGSQHRKEIGRLPLGHFAGLGGQFQRLLPIANLVIGASGQQPGKIAAGVGILRIEANYFREVSGRLGVLLASLVDIGAVEKRRAETRIEANDLAVIGDGFVQLFL